MKTPLHQLGDALRELCLQIPLPMVRGLFLAVPVLLLIWVIRLPREQTTPAQAASRWDGNLKFGASLALIIQILIYSFL